jgi:hypothetical protein
MGAEMIRLSTRKHLKLLLGVCLLALLIICDNNVVNGQWKELSAENPPGERFGSAAVYCPGRDSMILFSGFRFLQESNERYQALSDMWEYSFTANTWRLLPQTSTPTGRVWASLTYLPNEDVGTAASSPNTCLSVLIGGALKTEGNTESFVSSDELWMLNVSDNRADWKRLTPVNDGPAQRSMHQTVYRRGKLVLMGGHRFSTTTNTAFDDLWVLTLDNLTSNLNLDGNHTWTQVTKPDDSHLWIRPRFSHAMALHTGTDPASDRLVIFGGTTYVNQRDSDVLSDVCVYNFVTNEWDFTTGVELERTAHGAMIWNGRFFAFGGSTRVRLSASTFRTFVFDDFLVTNLNGNPSGGSSPSCTTPDGKTGLWCTAFSAKSDLRPLVRYNYIYVQRRDQFVVYGGSFKNLLGDFWIVSTTSALPTLVLSEPDILEGGSDLASTVYFMIAILSMMIICFMVFIVSLRRHRAGHPVFILGGGGAINHPRITGARPSVVAALPVRAYRKTSKNLPDIASAEVIANQGTATTVEPSASDDLHGLCAICLADYEDGEDVRVLPCQHFFHPNCIDQWLSSHNACPMCKAVVDSEPEQRVAEEVNAGQPALPVPAGAVQAVPVPATIIGETRSNDLPPHQQTEPTSPTSADERQMANV